MKSIVYTPSSKAHERVSGRWSKTAELESPRDRGLLIAKLIAGTPISWLMLLSAISLFLSRGALEVGEWSVLGLGLIYACVDLWTKPKEFTPFTLGFDGSLLIFAVFALISCIAASGSTSFLFQVSDLRWIVLTFMWAYAFSLFPGLNRFFGVLAFGATVTAIYGIVQHFQGWDWLRATSLDPAPFGAFPFFQPKGFARSSEVFAVSLLMALPFFLTTFFYASRRDQVLTRAVAFTLTLVTSLAIFWSYRMGIWIAWVMTFLVLMTLGGERRLQLLFFIALIFGGVSYLAYGTPNEFFTQVELVFRSQTAVQRDWINSSLELWKTSPWIGVGKSESLTALGAQGNVYFEWLARFGICGLIAYLAFTLRVLSMAYNLWKEIPSSHLWHKVLTSGCLGSILTFHICGLYCRVYSDSLNFSFYAAILGALGYVRENYQRGLVPDDFAL